VLVTFWRLMFFSFAAQALFRFKNNMSRAAHFLAAKSPLRKWSNGSRIAFSTRRVASGRHQFALGLALELRVLDEQRQNDHRALHHIIRHNARRAFLFLVISPNVRRPLVSAARRPCFVRAAVGLLGSCCRTAMHGLRLRRSARRSPIPRGHGHRLGPHRHERIGQRAGLSIQLLQQAVIQAAGEVNHLVSPALCCLRESTPGSHFQRISTPRKR
jgi:hypothetical protein